MPNPIITSFHETCLSTFLRLPSEQAEARSWDELARATCWQPRHAQLASTSLVIMKEWEIVILPALRHRLDEAGLGHVLGIDHRAHRLSLVNGAGLREQLEDLL